MIKVNVLVCPVCGDKIFSRARHDYRSCTCGEIAVDGGFEYSRIVFKEKPPKSIEIEIDETKEELYDDWSHCRDMFGIVGKDSKPRMKKKHVIDRNISGHFNSWNIGNIEIKELIEQLDDLRKQHPDHEIRLDLEYDQDLKIPKLVYTVWRLETDDEFEARKKQSEKDILVARKKKEDRIKRNVIE